MINLSASEATVYGYSEDEWTEMELRENLRAIREGVMEELENHIDLAIMANGGEQWRKDWCSCDPSVGAVPCEYCAIYKGLKACKDALPAFQSMREKARRYDFLENNIASDISGWETWKADAEKWNKQQGQISQILTDARRDINLLMSRMEVRKKCEAPINPKDCLAFHGTGYVIRNATPEEVRELIEWSFRPHEHRFSRDEEGNWYFITSKGGKLRMKGE